MSVREEDQGCYMCQINTAKMKLQVGCIKILGMSEANIYDCLSIHLFDPQFLPTSTPP